MLESFKKILFILSVQERKKAIVLFVMILLMAIIDIAGIASILPFITVLTNPGIIDNNFILNQIYEKSKIFGVQNINEFLFISGILVFIVLILGVAFKALTTFVTIRFSKMREYSLSRLLVECYLKQPYVWFLERNSADLGKAVLSEAGTVAGDGVKPFIDLFASTIVVVTIVILLMLIDFKIAFVIGFMFITAYVVIFKFTRNYLKKIGKENLQVNEVRYMSISEAFGAKKEIKVGGLEKIYFKRFSQSAEKFSRNQSHASILAALPRFALEAIAFGGAMLLILYLMLDKGGFNNALPVISIYIFAGYRLMPAIQNAYIAISSITFASPSIDLLYKDIKNLKSTKLKEINKKKILINKFINLNNINFIYPKASKMAIKAISLKIKAQTTVGIVGTTGCGKTTLVDIILGLLEPSSGTFDIDGEIITKDNLRSWQRSIGFVPQHIFLADDTIAANIAFGVNSDEANKDLIEASAKAANIHDFIISELPKKYQTKIGESGIRLSGGQRQRIGIARALYHKPQLLIFDEATSALDNNTEEAVMEAINNIGKKSTIILITHRLNTVRKCNNIIILDKGKIKKQGTFQELAIDGDYFTSMDYKLS